jgi:hypothetical protein
MQIAFHLHAQSIYRDCRVEGDVESSQLTCIVSLLRLVTKRRSHSRYQTLRITSTTTSATCTCNEGRGVVWVWVWVRVGVGVGVR